MLITISLHFFYTEDIMQIFTVGHSNHTIDRFIVLLKQHGITALADVRSSPFSRYSPHFNQSSLKNYLSYEGISYVFLGKQLGARPKNIDCYVEGKARYDLIASTKEFNTGLERIRKGVKHHQIALMCAEQDPITCHRAILVCKHLKSTEMEIKHILKTGELETNEHLEKRLLKIHNFSETSNSHEIHKQTNSQSQLQLFNLDTFDLSTSNKFSIAKENQLSLEKLVSKAYDLQGDKIAYVEVNKNTYANHEQVS